ncbi:hypothetical protein J8J27_28715, partial [Mycobacterium tuberculosis]|nr:hypothetical protein [Mycobacterium tuberculosis]
EKDTIETYELFLDLWPDEALSRRVALLLAARREALTWFRTRSEDTANAYWSYLKRYPDGAHAADARRRLARLAAAAEPPARFEEIVYDV